jgi:predicted  nucleic acid-binding Zn-ribbon protein
MFDFIQYLKNNRLTQTDKLSERAKKFINEDYNPEIPDGDQKIGSSDKTSTRVGGVQSKLAMLKKKKDELVQKFTSGMIDIHQYKQMIGNIPQQIKNLQADLDRDTMEIGDDEDGMNERSHEKKNLGEVEVTEESELGQSVMKLAKMNDQIERLSVELKKLEKEHSELQKPIYSILEDLNKLHDNLDKSIKVGRKIIVSFKTKPTEVVTHKYKEAFNHLYSKVNGTMKKLVEDVLEANKSVSPRKGTISVTRLDEAGVDIAAFDSIANDFKDDIKSINNIVSKLTGGVA